jgi:hypothetical protein
MVWSKVIKINGYGFQKDGLSTKSVVVGHETKVDRRAPIRQAAPCCAFTVKSVVADRVRRVLGGADASWVGEGLLFGERIAESFEVVADGDFEFRGLGEVGVPFGDEARRDSEADDFFPPRAPRLRVSLD